MPYAFARRENQEITGRNRRSPVARSLIPRKTRLIVEAASSTGGVRETPSSLCAPATQAFLIQCLSLLIVLVLMRGLVVWSGIGITVIAAVLLQGTIAAVISRWRGLATWWLPIQLLFPGVTVAVYALQFPPLLFLCAFLFLLGLYWTTFLTQVPLYLSGPAVWESIAEQLPSDRPIRFIDIGSGVGGLILHLSAQRPDSTFTGIEIAPLPWLASWVRARVGHSNGHFIRGDYGRLDFADYDVVFAYLSPAAMPAVWRKASSEMRQGTLLLSHEFLVPSIAPDTVITPQAGGPSLYGWRIP